MCILSYNMVISALHHQVTSSILKQGNLTFWRHCNLLQHFKQVFRPVEGFRNGDIHSVCGCHGNYSIPGVHPDLVHVFLCNNSNTVPGKRFHYPRDCQPYLIKRSQKSRQRLKWVFSLLNCIYLWGLKEYQNFQKKSCIMKPS